MKIYLISQNEYSGYDTYDSAVVVAFDAEDAREINIGDPGEPFTYGLYNSWASSPENVLSNYLGEFRGDYPKHGIILTSFNPG
jgi:hypothetical protein